MGSGGEGKLVEEVGMLVLGVGEGGGEFLGGG